MNIQKKTRAMVEAALMTALTCIFAIMGTYIPVLTFILFFIPVPFIVLGKRHGIHFVILSIVASGIIVGSFTEPLQSIFVIGLPGITAIVMGYMMNKEYSPYKVLAGGSLAALVASLLSISIGSMIIGVDIVSQMSEAFKEAMDIQIKMYQTIGMEPEKLETLKKTLEATIQLVLMAIPAMLIFSSVFLSYINYVLTIRVLNRIGHKAESLPPLRYIRLPKSILMGTFLIIGLTMATKYFKIVSYQSLVLNVFLIFQFVYFIQGLAVVSYFLHAFNLRKVLRVLIYILLLFNGMGTFMVAMIGFVDAIVNLRKLKTDH
ncbi:DUF2232 domain-containing protein [Crassaminicella thermophila]|uniref:DUF2232 domain-containing protein n=1 Tax=Crassaminicella thermophila TaxID=2599308 RepID=A0A5C0SG84_CRATE|nr:YybS family protein [Crassaminicella thermophila]QEK13503.1 DUF2232 domain-containing protein [Crassaminicella thermophila]